MITIICQVDFTASYTLGLSPLNNQIMISRGFNHHAPGHVHFSAIAMLRDSIGMKASLLKSAYKNKALVPASPWLEDTPPMIPKVITEIAHDSLIIQWKHENPSDVFRTVVYFKYKDYWSYNIFNQSEKDCIIPKRYEIKNGKNDIIRLDLQEIAVSAVDRLGNESKLNHLTIH